MTFDDNALYRRPTISELRDFDEEDPKEVEATGHGLNYIALDGDVGCIVNGAGLAMADPAGAGLTRRYFSIARTSAWATSSAAATP